MKTKEEILAKRIIRFPAGDRRLAAGAMTDEAIKRNVYAAMEEYAAQFKDSPYQAGSAGVWRSDQAPELVDGKKAIPRHVIAEKKTHDGKTYKSKRVAYYFPERFKSVEFEDWDDYDPKDFPYTTQDEEKGVVWLKAGWYESVNCDRCDEYWSAPLDVIEWLDESAASPAGDGEAIEILKELCWLKSHKDNVGKDSVYRQRQPEAWKRANDFLNRLTLTTK